MNKNISKLIKEIQQDNEFSFSDFLAFLSNENSYMDLWPLASQKTKLKRHKLFSCGIISAKSGACTENCAFCAQSSQHKTTIKKHGFIKLDKMLERAEALAQAGASYMGIVCSGGSLKDTDLDYLCKTAEEIKKRIPINLCASIGAINTAQAISIKKAGLSKYHHNLETSEKFFPKICTTHSFKSRQDNIKTAQKAQLEICSGGIFGLGESWQDRWDLAMELKKLQVKSVPINFLMPIKNTRMEKQKILGELEALTIISLFRLILDFQDIIICGGRNLVFKKQDETLFSSGANALMVGDYLTTQGCEPRADFKISQKMGDLNVI